MNNNENYNEFLCKFTEDEFKRLGNEDLVSKIKKLIKYYEYEKVFVNGRIKYTEVNSTEDDIERFYETIKNDVFLNILYRLRNDILKSKRKRNKIFKNEELRELYQDIFFLDKEILINIIKHPYLSEFYKELEEKTKYTERQMITYLKIIDNFEKDNLILKIIALRLFANQIINDNYFNEKKENHKIELKCKANSFHKIKSIRSIKADGLREVYDTLSDLMDKIINKEINLEVKDYNIWISLYEINSKYGYISSIAIGEILEKYKIHIYGKNIDKAEENLEKKTILMTEAAKSLVSNNIFMLNYFLKHDSKLVSLLAGENEEDISTLLNIYRMIEDISEKLYKTIKSKDSLLYELNIIKEINCIIKPIEFNNLIGKNINNGAGKRIIYAYQLFHSN